MSDIASDETQTLTDEAILARFHASKNPPPSARTLGFALTAVSQAERRVEIAFDARADLLANPMGQVQGGFVCAMLDECMSVAGMIASGMTHVVPTLEMKTSFLRPAMPGPLRGVGRVVKWGRTVCFMEGELYDAEGRLLATSTGTALPTPFAKFKT
ncbi:PaaI family thioesterase [Caulobacter endophyticus]|uniref:PaaI family thioesterase n=1 Tax=Caulobacter endophyticus TaxID=2172652 RepID=UPI00240F3E6A|nr:PaaI family thioesterase [Caulobacter endophyticus]MDG2531917.1 PaaI family thioesterase [Caulobacter endophyticus]